MIASSSQQVEIRSLCQEYETPRFITVLGFASVRYSNLVNPLKL